MTRDNIIRRLHIALCEAIYEDEKTVEEMAEEVLQYYNAAGFDFRTIDEIIEHIDAN